MNMKRMMIVGVTAISLTALGCTEAEPPKSDAIEQVTSAKPTLTSAVPSTKPVEAKKREPLVPEAKEAPSVAETQPVAKERSFEPTLDSVDGLTIQRLITAPAVEHREPVAASSVFGHADETVYAFVEVSNESEEGKTLLVHFIGPDGQASGGIDLRIPRSVPRWRTWAYTKHAKKPGLWHVEIRNIDGSLLGAVPFEVEAAD